MRTRLRSGVVAVTLIVTSTLGGAMLMGAQGSLRGDERGVWTDDRTSVVIAKLKAVRQKGEPGASDREADLIPLATLAGSFDSSSEIDVTARLWVGGVGSAIRNDPPVNAIVIAVIRQDYLGYQISPEICLFMPEQKGLVVIEGFGDPKVLQTIEKIRAVRHKGHPATRPATQPVAVPATRVSE